MSKHCADKNGRKFFSSVYKLKVGKIFVFLGLPPPGIMPPGLPPVPPPGMPPMQAPGAPPRPNRFMSPQMNGVFNGPPQLMMPNQMASRPPFNAPSGPGGVPWNRPPPPPRPPFTSPNQPIIDRRF